MPALSNGILYVTSGTEGVFALNASTGRLIWSHSVGIGSYSTPAVVNGVVYVGSGDGQVYALSASTGALKWSYAEGGVIVSSPSVANGVVYVGNVGGSTSAQWTPPVGRCCDPIR